MKITDRSPIFAVLSLGHFVIMIILCLLTLTGLYLFHGIYTESEEKRQNEMTSQQLEEKIKAVILEQKEWDKIRPTYEKMQQLRLFSSENRLLWIETIQSLITRFGGLELHYTLKPKKKIRLPSALIKVPKKTTLFASHMQLSFLAPHEEVLIQFIQQLQLKHIGYFIVKAYQIQRTEHRYLQITLVLEWLSFYDEKQEKQLDTSGEPQDE